MAVRRLAPDAIQPAAFAFSAENRRWADGEIGKYPQGRQASAVIPLLWQAQKQAGGWLPKAAIEHVAQALDMPSIRVLEVATFYTMFNLAPVGKHFVQLCGTTPCMLRGAEDLKKVCRERIGPERAVSADGQFSWLEVECLGACCNAPMVQVNDDYYEDLTAEGFCKLMDDLAAGRPVKPGPQSERRSSEPLGSVTTLADPALFDGSLVGAWRKRVEADAAVVPLTPAAAPPPAPVPPPPAPAESKPAVVAAVPAAAAPARPEGTPPTGTAKDTPAAGGAATQAPGSAGAAAGPAGAAAAAAEQEALAKAEEAAITAKLAAMPKGASAEDKANAVGARPAGLAAARDGKADDLKRIRGIGKVNEGKLNTLGVFHFDQIARWSREEIRWVGTYLAFPGRIDREDWVGQAKTLASGGVTDFAKRVDKGDVPTSKG